MKQFQYTIQAPVGLHGRPAAQLVKAAKDLDSEITVEKAGSGRSASAARLIALMTLGVKQGDAVTVTVTGGDEEANARAMERFFRENL